MVWLVKQYPDSALVVAVVSGNVTMDSVHSFRSARETTGHTSACLGVIKEAWARSCREAMSITQNTKY